MTYEVTKFGRKWGIVFRLDATTSFDQHVRYTTKREAVSIAALLNREYLGCTRARAREDGK